jgi:hypothetical protein
MPHVYQNVSALQGKDQVENGECVRLVQHFLPHVGHTSTWRPGERVIDILERGGHIEQGTAVSTFVNGRYPTGAHKHAGFYDGVVTSCAAKTSAGRCSVMGIALMDQWRAKPRIARRTVYRRGGMYSNGDFPDISNNAEALYTIAR